MTRPARTRPSASEPGPPARPAAKGGARGKTASVDPKPERPARKAGGRTSAVVVGESPIHGRGLFAARVIEAGERIGTYSGPRSSAIDTYVLWVEDEQGNEYGIEGRNDLRFVNHSAEPNAVFEGLELHALRRIEPGEEITHHYGEEWDDL